MTGSIRDAVGASLKPWGWEVLWALTRHYAARLLFIRRGHQLSLQYHRTKDESLLLRSGRLILVLEDERGGLMERWLRPGDREHIPAGRLHRLLALDDCEVVEVSTPEQDDIVRVEDGSGQTGPLSRRSA